MLLEIFINLSAKILIYYVCSYTNTKIKLISRSKWKQIHS